MGTALLHVPAHLKACRAQKCHFEQSLACPEGSSMLYFFVSQSTIAKANMFLCRVKSFKFIFVP